MQTKLWNEKETKEVPEENSCPGVIWIFTEIISSPKNFKHITYTNYSSASRHIYNCMKLG